MTSKEEYLTAEELRARLYHGLKDKGVVDVLKSQLRNRLVNELRQSVISREAFPVVISSDVDSNSLLLRASNSLVADHLERCGYDYTYSVFLPESVTQRDKMMTISDLLQLLNISHQSKLYKKLIAKSHSDRKQGFLWELLCELSAVHAGVSRDTQCQTDPLRLPPPTSLEEQFRRVDEQYDKEESKFVRTNFEERILAHQRNIEERAKADLKIEIERFRENELSQMRLVEREKCRKDLDVVKKELERLYQSKHDALIERERQNVDRHQKQQEIAERDIYSRRQALLQEIDAVRDREAALRRLEEAFNREKQLMEEKWKSRDELLKRREDFAKRAEIEVEQRLKDEITKYKLEEQSRYLERSKNLEFREAKVKDDQRRLTDELRDIQSVKDELREKRAKLNEAEAELLRIQHELISAEKRGELMTEKVREMTDYKVVKEEYGVMKRELDSCRTRIAELTRDNIVERQKQEELLREMGERNSKPSSEVYMLQRQLEKTKEELIEERVMADHQRQLAQNRYQQELDRNKEMLLKYEEQTMQMKEMTHELADLRLQLHGTSAALYNEIYHKPTPVRRRLVATDDEAGQSGNVHYDYIDPMLIRNVADPTTLFCAEVHDAHVRSVSPALPKSVLKPASHKVSSPRQTKVTPRTELTTTSTDSEDPSVTSELQLLDAKRRLKTLDQEYELLSRHYHGALSGDQPPGDVLATPPHHHHSHHAENDQEEPVAAYSAHDRVDGGNTSKLYPVTPVKHASKSHPHSSSTPAKRHFSDKLEADMSGQVDKPAMDTTLSTIDGGSPDRRQAPYPASPPLDTQYSRSQAVTSPVGSKAQPPVSYVTVERHPPNYMTVSEVGGSSARTPVALTSLPSGSTQRPIAVSDLDARPGSPSVLVLGDSASTRSSASKSSASDSPSAAKPATSTPSTSGTTTQSTEQKSSNDAPLPAAKAPEVRVSLDAAWKQKAASPPPSTADVDAQRKRDAEERERREAEERRQYEEESKRLAEERKKRDAERQLKAQQAWEQQQEELRRLEQAKQPSTASSSSTSAKAAVEVAEEAKESPAATPAEPAEPEIHPDLLKYMEIVKQKKEQEKQQATQKAAVPEKAPTQRVYTLSDEDDDEDELEFEGAKSKKGGNWKADDEFW